MALGARDEIGQERVRDHDRPDEVDAVGLEVARERDLAERAAEDDAGVVDEDVDRAALAVDLVAGRRDRVRVADVEGDGGQPPVRRQARQRGGVEVGDNRAGARGVEPPRNREAQARGAAGHQHAFVRQVAHGGIIGAGGRGPEAGGRGPGAGLKPGTTYVVLAFRPARPGQP